jgi:hypothetical protein
MQKSVNSKYQGGYGGFGVAGHILGFLKGSLNSPVSPTTLPPASQGLSDSERQDLLEQAAQSRMELAHVMELLNKERRRGDKLQNELSKAQAGEHQVQGAEERARTEMQKALDELQQARIVDQRHKSQLMVSQEEQTRLMTKLTEADGLKKKMEAKIRILLREKGEATKCLHIATAKEAQTPTPVKISLDVFDNTLDQVSEAHVKVSGHPSISGLNDSLDNLVSVVLEQAPNLAAAYTGYRASVSETESDLPPAMLAALAMTDLTEDNRGLLLDASLHHIVLRQLYSLFFYGEGVAIVIEETDILEQVLQYVTRDGAGNITIFYSLTDPIFRNMVGFAEVPGNTGLQCVKNVWPVTLGGPSTMHCRGDHPNYLLGIWGTRHVFRINRTERLERAVITFPRCTRTICRLETGHSLRPDVRRPRF